MSVTQRAVDEALAEYERVQPTLQGRGAQLSYRLAYIVRGLTDPCDVCGGDGVLIDDDPESTRQIVTTCRECGGNGHAGLAPEPPEPAST
jgi:DnaJ-class molecular chaperone